MKIIIYLHILPEVRTANVDLNGTTYADAKDSRINKSRTKFPFIFFI